MTLGSGGRFPFRDGGRERAVGGATEGVGVDVGVVGDVGPRQIGPAWQTCSGSAQSVG